MANMTIDDHDMAKLEAAKKLVEKEYLDNPHKADKLHTVYIGLVEKDGKLTDEMGVVVQVTEKLPEAFLQEGDKVPGTIEIQGEPVRVDVREVPRPTDRRLYVPEELIQAASNPHPSPDQKAALEIALAAYDFQLQCDGIMAQAIAEWRQCFNCPIPGGVQIAPENAGWVGTLTCALRGQDADGKWIVGCMSNYHVAVSAERRGIKMGQPSGSGNLAFATLETWSPMKFSTSANNRVDAAFMSTLRDGMYTVMPSQFKIGDINPKPVLDYKVGDRVQKSGRTTGWQKGRVVGVNATSHIGYGQGTARFTGQLIIAGDNGDLSGPGDSGSLILTEADNRPYGLLFAGGGGQTIANQIKDVIEIMKVEFVGMDYFAKRAA